MALPYVFPFYAWNFSMSSITGFVVWFVSCSSLKSLRVLVIFIHYFYTMLGSHAGLVTFSSSVWPLAIPSVFLGVTGPFGAVSGGLRGHYASLCL